MYTYMFYLLQLPPDCKTKASHLQTYPVPVLHKTAAVSRYWQFLYIHIYTHIYVYTKIHEYICIHVHVYIYIYVRVILKSQHAAKFTV